MRVLNRKLNKSIRMKSVLLNFFDKSYEFIRRINLQFDFHRISPFIITCSDTDITLILTLSFPQVYQKCDEEIRTKIE